jgi:hypothetical protein
MSNLDELNETFQSLRETWALEIATDIDLKLQEYAANWKETIPASDNSLTHVKWRILFETQKARIDLLKAIMRD